MCQMPINCRKEWWLGTVLRVFFPSFFLFVIYSPFTKSMFPYAELMCMTLMHNSWFLYCDVKLNWSLCRDFLLPLSPLMGRSEHQVRSVPLELVGIQCFSQGHFSKADACWHRGLNPNFLAEGQSPYSLCHPVAPNGKRLLLLQNHAEA